MVSAKHAPLRRSLVVHGHFYQPPRENPWTGLIDPEPSAAPHANWNERVYQECYRPNAFARIYNGEDRLHRIENNYASMSFNFGATLLSWIERQHPEGYARIVEADAAFGGAVAQAYFHVILPLANPRDRATLIRWGLADFSHRFGRKSRGLWLPETAANRDVLEALIESKVAFTIMSPHQAAAVRPLGGGEWEPVENGAIDSGVPFRVFHRDGSGRSLDLFFYDGDAARAIAFDGALRSSQTLVDAIENGGGTSAISVATDGESYGHHARFGDLSLAHALFVETRKRGLATMNYEQLLATSPPTHEVMIDLGEDGRGSSWSCAHGVGRWFRDCGCKTGGEEHWRQPWRTNLRDALGLLRRWSARKFESKGSEFFAHPWAVREDYVRVLLGEDPEKFVDRHARPSLDPSMRQAARLLLEGELQMLKMYTSCGWFFSDLAGIETQQCLRYASYGMDALEAIGLQPPRDAFIAELGRAKSNVDSKGDGAELFARVEASIDAPARQLERLLPRFADDALHQAHLVRSCTERIARISQGSPWRSRIQEIAFAHRAHLPSAVLDALQIAIP